MRPSAAQQQAYTLPPDQYRAAIEFNREVNALYFIATAWTLVILALLWRRGAGQRLARFGWWSAFILMAILSAAELPIAAWRHHLGLFYGLSVEPWLPWLADWLKSSAISTLLGAAGLLGVISLIRRSPRRWWLYAWALSVVAMIAATYAAPLIFDPLFHSFRPLGDRHPELIAPVQAVAERGGEPVPAGRIFEMNASQKTRTLNAYMTGFGSSRRIVIWDTTVQRLTVPQVQTVFAHEVGHYALHHIPKSIAAGSIGLLVVLFLLRGLRFDGYARLPQWLFWVTLAGFAADPVVNSYSRWQEHQADIFELQIMSSLVPNAGANSAEVDQIMAQAALDDPDPNPLIEFWLYDHPATNDRMRFAQSW